MTPNEKLIQEQRREIERLMKRNADLEKQKCLDDSEIVRLRRMYEVERGGILSGLKIQDEVRAGRIMISDFDPCRLNPNSYNLRLANELLIYESGTLDMKKPNKCNTLKIPKGGLVLLPGCLYLGRTMERTATDYYVPILDGRSSVGRLGITIHVTAGFGDIGFTGFWTLEITCIHPVKVYAGVDICQIGYHTIVGDYKRYSSEKYQNNSGIQPSLMFRDFAREGISCE